VKNNYVVESTSITNHGIEFVLKEYGAWGTNWEYDEEAPLDSEEEDYSGTYFLSHDNLIHKKINKIFDFLTNSKTKYLEEFLSASKKKNDKAGFYKYRIEEALKLFVDIKKNNNLKYLLDYNLIQLLDLASYNNHRSNHNIINLKSSDTRYSHEDDDLVHDRVFFFANSPEKVSPKEEEAIHNILNLFSSHEKDGESNLGDQESALSKINFFDESNQVAEYMSHEIGSTERGSSHSKNSINLIYNLISNGDKKSFFSAYHLIMDNHSFKELESDLRKSVDLTSTKIHVPWKIESRNESYGENEEDMYLSRSYVSENHLMSLKKLFFKILAETAPITYFLDFHYTDPELKAYTKAAVSSFILVGSQNDLLDTSDKKSQFSYSTFMYIFSQLYLNGSLNNLEDIGNNKLFLRIERIIRERLTNADLKRILNMILPYANSHYSNLINVYNNSQKYLGNSKDKQEYDYISNKLKEVKNDLNGFESKFSKIQDIFFQEFKKRNDDIGADYSEDSGFKIKESDFSYNFFKNLHTNTYEEILSMKMESGEAPPKEEALAAINSEKNENLALFCYKNNIINFMDLSNEILNKINIYNLDENDLSLFKETLIKKNIYEAFCARMLKKYSRLADLKSIHDISKISKGGFLTPFFDEKTNNSLPLFISVMYIKRNKKKYYMELFNLFENASDLNNSYNQIKTFIYLSDINKYMNEMIIGLGRTKPGFFSIEDKYHKAIMMMGMTKKVDLSYLPEDIIEEILDDKSEKILSMYAIDPDIFGRESVSITQVSFLGNTYNFHIKSNLCMNFIDKSLEAKKEDLLFAHLNAGGQFIHRAAKVIESKKIHSDDIEAALSKELNYPNQIGPIINLTNPDKGSFSYLIKSMANFDDLAEYSSNEEGSIDEFLSSKKDFALNVIRCGISSKYLLNSEKFIESMSKFASDNDDAKKVFMFILNNISEIKELEGLAFKRKDDIPDIIFNKNLIMGKNIILKDEIENLNYIVVIKNKKLKLEYDFDSKKREFFKNIAESLKSSNFSNVNKVINFLGIKDESEKIYKNIESLITTLGLSRVTPYQTIPKVVIDNDILIKMETQNGDEILLKKTELDEFYCYLLHDTGVSFKSSEVGSLNSINRVASLHFTKLASDEKISEKLKFMYLILSYGITLNSKKDIQFNSIRSISSASNLSNELKASMRKLFKNKSEEMFEEANSLLAINSIIKLDNNSEYLFKEILKENDADFSKNAIKFIKSIRSNPLDIESFRNLSSAVYELKSNLSSIKLPLRFSSIEKFIKYGLKQDRGANSRFIKKIICSDDCKNFYDFPHLLSGFSASNVMKREYNDFFLSLLEGRGYSVGGVNLSLTSGRFFNKTIEYCKDTAIKDGAFLSTMQTHFSLNKEDIFSKFSEIFKVLKILGTLTDGIDDSILDKYKPKNKIFSNFNLEGRVEDSGKPSFRTRVIPEKDAYALIVGVDTGCCQHVGGAANDVCIESLIGENSGVIMFEKYCGDAGFGHAKSVDEGYCLFGQAFTSIFENYIILDSIEFKAEYASAENTENCLRLLYDACKKMGKTLICGPSNEGPGLFDGSIFSEIKIDDERNIWSGPIKNSYSDFTGDGLLIEFPEKKEAFYVQRLIKLAKYIEENIGYSESVDVFSLI